MGASSAIRAGRAFVELLRTELEVREAIDEQWRPVRQEERQAAWQKAMTVLDEVRAQVKQSLISIGYVDGVIPGGEVNSITPDMIQRHPDVFAHTQALHNREAQAQTTEDFRANRDEMERVRGELTTQIRRAVAGAM